MPAILDEIVNFATDLVRVARDRRLSRRLLTRDHDRAVKSSDLWFWTRAWQLAEDEAAADVKAGRYADFAGADQLVRALDHPSDDAVLAALRQPPPRSAP